MHLFHQTVAAAALSAAAGLSFAANASAETLLRWTEGSGDRGPRAETFHWFADTVTERSGGEIEFQFYFGGALMGHAANVSGIGSRAADIGQIIAVYTPKELLPYGVGDLPLVDADAWVGLRAMYELATTNPTIIKMFDDLNLVYVTNLTTGPVQLLCKDLDVTALDDLKGVKIRASGLYGQVLTEIGANVISLSQEKVYSALDTGLVTCNQQYVQGVIPYRQHEVASHLTLLNWGQFLGFGVVMNKDAFNELTADQQDIIRKTGSEFIDRYAETLARDTEKARKALRSSPDGYTVEINALPAPEVAKLDQVSQIYIGKWVEDLNAAGYQGDKLLEDFVRLIDKYRAILKEDGYPWER